MKRLCLAALLAAATLGWTSGAAAYYCEYPANPTQRAAYRECMERQKVAKEREKEMRERARESERQFERNRRDRDAGRTPRY